jgi:hypothetical protein
MAKHNHYSTLEAKEILLQEQNQNKTIDAKFFGNAQQRRRWIKRHVYPKLPVRWLFRFFWMYFLKLGFLDGITGLRFCLFISSYELLISLKTVELKQEASHGC